MAEKSRKSNTKGWLVVLACMSLVICLLVVAIVVVINNRPAVEHPVETDSDSNIGEGTIFDDWGEYIANNDMKGLIEMTDKAIQTTDDIEKKAVLYASRAGVLYNYDIENRSSEYSAQILADVYSAEELYPSGNTAYLIYYYEQEFGNDAVAKEYLKVAEERGMTMPPGKG